MAISNGSTITTTDLNAMVSGSLGLLQADNAQLPLGFETNLYFHGITSAISSGNPERCKSVLVVPFDCYLEVLGLRCSAMTAASSTTATLTSDGAGYNFPKTVTAATGVGIVDASRLLHNNTKTKGFRSTKLTTNLPMASTHQAFLAFTRGQTITVNVTTTSIAAGCFCQVTLVLRQFFAREL